MKNLEAALILLKLAECVLAKEDSSQRNADDAYASLVNSVIPDIEVAIQQEEQKSQTSEYTRHIKTEGAQWRFV